MAPKRGLKQQQQQNGGFRETYSDPHPPPCFDMTPKKSIFLRPS